MLCDPLLVGIVQGSLVGDPMPDVSIVSLLMSCTAKGAYQTPLTCIGPILTTCRTFSFFKMASLRPLSIPATLNSLVPLIK